MIDAEGLQATSAAMSGASCIRRRQQAAGNGPTTVRPGNGIFDNAARKTVAISTSAAASARVHHKQGTNSAIAGGGAPNLISA